MSTRFNTVHPGRAPLPGPPRFTTVVFDMSKTTGKTPGSSRSIRHHPGPSRWNTVQPPVLPGSPRSMDRGEPGSTGSPVGLGHYQSTICEVSNRRDTHSGYYVTVVHRVHRLHPPSMMHTQFACKHTQSVFPTVSGCVLT